MRLTLQLWVGLLPVVSLVVAGALVIPLLRSAGDSAVSDTRKRGQHGVEALFRFSAARLTELQQGRMGQIAEAVANRIAAIVQPAASLAPNLAQVMRDY
eukprot:gene34224-51239_t